MKKNIILCITGILILSFLFGCSSSGKKEAATTGILGVSNFETSLLDSVMGKNLYNDAFENSKGTLTVISHSAINDNVKLLVNVHWQDDEKECNEKYNLIYENNNNQWTYVSCEKVESVYTPLKAPNEELLNKNNDSFFKYAKVLEAYEPDIDLKNNTATYSYSVLYSFQDIIEQKCKANVSYSFNNRKGEWQLSDEKPQIDKESIVSTYNFDAFSNTEYAPADTWYRKYNLTINNINADENKITATLVEPHGDGSFETHNLSGDFTPEDIYNRGESFYENNGSLHFSSSLFDENDPSFILKINFSICLNEPKIDSISGFVSDSYKSEGFYLGNNLTFVNKN